MLYVYDMGCPRFLQCLVLGKAYFFFDIAVCYVCQPVSMPLPHPSRRMHHTDGFSFVVFVSSAYLLSHIISPHRPHIKTIFQSIAAKVGSGEPCCDWVNIYLILTLPCVGSLVAETNA